MSTEPAPIVHRQGHPRPLPLDPASFRRAMSHVPTGVTVVTARAGDEARGMTVSAFASISLDPLLVLVSLRAACPVARVAEAAGTFAVNVLSEQQAGLSAWFASSARHGEREDFAGVSWTEGRSGAPVLAGCVTYLDCRLERVYPGGDHVLLLGRVLHLGPLRDVPPLLWYRAGYWSIGAAEPVSPSAR